MTKNDEIIKSLINEANGLPHRNFVKLDALKRRAKMIFENMYGDSNKYILELEEINFRYNTITRPKGTSGRLLVKKKKDYAWNYGKNILINLFKVILEEIELFGISDHNDYNEMNIENSNKIFIVHGHDEEMKQAVARALENIDLEPIILHDQPNQGRTIIEKFTDYSDVSFAIILLSPDDQAYSKNQPENVNFRARQNVILELGFFIGKLGRNRVFILRKDENKFEMPSDYNGVVYTSFDNNMSWKLELIKELNHVGYNIDTNKLI